MSAKSVGERSLRRAAREFCSSPVSARTIVPFPVRLLPKDTTPVMSAPALRLLFPLLLCTLAAGADSISEPRIERLFRPTLGERMALSADGRYLAYTQHTGTDLLIIVMDLDHPEKKVRIIADEDRPILHSQEKNRAQLRFLEWSAGHRLVFAPTIETIMPAASRPSADFIAASDPEAREFLAGIPPPEPIVIGPILAVDADGSNGRHLIEATDFQFPVTNPLNAAGLDPLRTPRPEILGFDPRDRNSLLLEIRKVYNAVVPTVTEVHRLDVQTGQHTESSRETGPGRFVYDQTGLPRISRESSYGGDSSFLYRTPQSDRWFKLPEPPGAGAAVSFVITPKTYFGERAIPLGFDFDPNVLIYAANVGRDTYGIYGLDLTTRQRTSITLEHPYRDLVSLDARIPSPALVFDKFRHHFAGIRAVAPRPFTVWVDAELAEVQRAVEAQLPRRTATILEWSEDRTRFLVQVTGGTEPGRTYLFQRPEGLMVELMRQAPWLPTAELHDTAFFEFTGPGGAPLTGYLTLPRHPRLNPPPLLIWFAPGLPPKPHPEFDRQAQVFADMGFIVCRLNHRGVLGLGAKSRDALRRDPDHTPAEDAMAAVEWIASHHRIDRKRVATYGEGFAAHLAMRATQLYPQAFRCVVAVDPIINLQSWLQPPADASGPPTFEQVTTRLFLEYNGASVHRLAVTTHPEDLNAPVFVLTRTAPRGSMDSILAAGIAQLRSQLRQRDLPCVTVTYNDDFVQGLPVARARVYRELEEFFNLNLYNYNVKIGPTREVK